MSNIPKYKVIKTDDKIILFFTETLDIVSIEKNKFEKITQKQIIDFYNKSIQRKNIQNKDKFATPKNLAKIMLNLSDDCNLDCIYCYANKYHKNNSSITVETIDKLISKFFLSDAINRVNRVVFFGGEPLLNVPALEYFLDEIEKLFNIEKIPNMPIYSIITNGTIYNERILDILKKNDIGVIVSIDGPENIQNLQRPFKNSQKGTFKTVSQNIKKMVRDGLKVGYECTITKRTLELGYNQQNLKEFFKEELGLPYGFLVPENFTSPNRYFDYYKFTGYENPYIEALYSLDVNSEHFEIPYRLLTKHPILHPCGLGRDIFHILSTGGIYPCQLISGMEDFKIGNLDTFDDKMFNSNIFTKMFDISLNKRCQKCWIRHLCKFCPARNFLETKSFMLNEKICQNRRKEMEEFLIEVVKIREDTIKWNELSKKIKKKRENSNASIQID